MTLDIEEFIIIKTLISVMEKEIKAQKVETQLALDSLYRDEKYKANKQRKLALYVEALEWLQKQL